MCRQFYVGCRHLTCPNMLRTLHREPCGQHRCEGVTYSRWKNWRSAQGSGPYCSACEDMGPEEWALRVKARNREKAKKRLQEKAAIRRQIREEKARLKRLQRAEEKKKKNQGPKPRRPYKARKKSVPLPPLEELWSARPDADWGNSFFGTPPPPDPPKTCANACRCSLCVPQSGPTTYA